MGYYCTRSVMSHGTIDIYANDKVNKFILMVQCKDHKKLGNTAGVKAELRDLVKLAHSSNIIPVYAYKTRLRKTGGRKQQRVRTILADMQTGIDMLTGDDYKHLLTWINN